MCLLRNRMTGIQLPGLALKLSAFADDLAVAVSSPEDAATMRRCFLLHEKASDARLNDDKTIAMPIGRPSFTVSYRTLQPTEPTRYLGILFTSQGLATDVMLQRMEDGIRITTERWKDRRLSLVGRSLLTNTCLLAKLWFTAHAVPLPRSFEKRILKIVRPFVW
ncbi:hypothetical protein SYNPS1DRAFT_13991, partial [Syncephalis pseudoplumigaleata]